MGHFVISLMLLKDMIYQADHCAWYVDAPLPLLSIRPGSKFPIRQFIILEVLNLNAFLFMLNLVEKDFKD